MVDSILDYLGEVLPMVGYKTYLVMFVISHIAFFLLVFYVGWRYFHPTKTPTLYESHIIEKLRKRDRGF